MRALMMLVAAAPFLAPVIPGTVTHAQVVAARQSQERPAVDVSGLLRPARIQVQDMPLSAALMMLSERSGVAIAFSPSRMWNDHAVDCDCLDVTVSRALDIMLASTRYGYTEVDGHVVVIPKRTSDLPSTDLWDPARQADRPSIPGVLATRVTSSASPPSLRVVQRLGTITGRVVDAITQQPLSTVQVHIPELELGTLTTPQGYYTIPNLPAGTHTLVAEVIGYRRESQEVTVIDDSTVVVNFQLVQTAVTLDEVVAVGYATQTRATVSGAVSTLSAEELSRTSATTTAEALVGKMAGINARMPAMSGAMYFNNRVPGDGRPGASTVLQIRNMGNPLFIIDGVPQDAFDFNHLNVADIADISILKDASAAVYGFRASNGVVLVTTKRGAQSQRPKLQIDSYYGWQYIDRSRTPFGYGNTAFQHMYSIIESQQNMGQPRSMTREELDQWRFAPTYQSFKKVVNNQGAMQANMNASLSGGSADATYYFSVGHVNQDYVMRDNNFNRTNFQANLKTSLFTGLSIGTELRGHAQKHTLTASGAADDPIVAQFRAIQSTWPFEDWYANGNPNYVHGNVRYLIRSPAVMRRDISGTVDQFRRTFSGTLWAQYEFPFGLSVRATFSHTINTHQFDQQQHDIEGYCYDEETDTYYVCAFVAAAARQHVREIDKSDFGQVQLSYRRRLGPHTFSSVGVVEINGGESTGTELRSIPPHRFSHLIDLVDVNALSNSWSINRRASYAGRFNYDYDQKYLIEAVGRYDGSYLYAPGKRWGFFPGVSVGWRITEEPFLRDRIGFLNELKIRASWGETGREQGISAWGYLDGYTYGAGNGAVLDDRLITGVRPRGLPVTNLSWVTSTSRNLGFDFEIFDRRLSGEFDIFERRLSGLPAARYDVVLPSEVGFNLPNENLESEAHRGVEGILRYSDRIGSVAFSVSPSFTLSRRIILDRYKPRYGNSWLRYRNATEHRWQGVAFGYRHIGHFKSVEEIENYPVDIDGQGNRTLLPGDLIFEDVNGDGIVDALDQRPIGWGEGQPPTLMYGLSGSFGYRNFSLTYTFSGGTMFSYSTGLDLRIPYNADHGGGAYIWSRWRRADPYDDTSEWIPGKFPPLRRGQQNHSSYRVSDFNRQNVIYLRLKRVELGYTLPGDFANRLGFGSARVYASSANPFVIDRGEGWAMDPEAGGCCAQLYPTAGVVTIGISATLGGEPAPGPLAGQ